MPEHVDSVFSDPSIESNFRRDGYVVVSLLQQEEVQSLQTAFLQLMPEIPTDFFATLFLPGSPLRRTLSEAVRRATESQTQHLMPGHTVRFNDFIAKRGESSQPLPMHQDYSFVDPTRHSAVHLWCPLIDVDERNGCLKVVKGSHRLGPHISAVPYAPSPIVPFRTSLESECMTSIPMKAGEGFFFDERLLHGSNPNLSTGIRTAVAGAYLPRDVTQRLYLVNEADPALLDIVEVSDQFAVSLSPGKPLRPPYPEGVTFLESISYTMPIVTLQQIDALRIRPSLVAPGLPAEVQHDGPGSKRPKSGLFQRLFKRF